jgi:hypothetical protein
MLSQQLPGPKLGRPLERLGLLIALELSYLTLPPTILAPMQQLIVIRVLVISRMIITVAITGMAGRARFSTVRIGLTAN